MGVWMILAPLLVFAAGQEEKKKKINSDCPNIWYTSETCPCTENPCKVCACGTCSGGAECCCIRDLRKGTGILKGIVIHKSVAKAPTVVYVEAMDGREFVLPRTTPRIVQKDKEFAPRIVPLLVGSTMEFANDDAFDHNINSPDNEKFNLGNWGQGGKRTYTFSRPGVYTLLCALHPEMVGYAVVVQTPYFAIANGKGEFRIPNVPAGKWKLRIWNERLKPKQLESAYDGAVEEGKDTSVEIKP